MPRNISSWPRSPARGHGPVTLASSSSHIVCRDERGGGEDDLNISTWQILQIYRAALPRALLLHTAEHCQHRRLCICMRLLREMLVFGLKRTWNGCQLPKLKLQNATKWHWRPIENVRWPYKMCIMLHIAQGPRLSSIQTSLGSGDTNCRLLVADLSWFLGWVIMWDVRVWGNCDVVWAAGNWI